MKFKKIGDFLVKAVSSVFFIGYLPFVPGTFGSLAGVGIFCLLRNTAEITYFLFTLGVVVLGLITSGRMGKLLGKSDPSCVVIDEVAGMLVALSYLPVNFKVIFLAFLIFRILDTLKPFPAGRLEHLPGSVGILADDLIAGIYTHIVLLLILNLNILI